MKRNYDDPHYKKFRVDVLKRDKHRCRMCNSKRRLNVHHILKWSGASSLRYDVDNGITLCKKCHDSITGKEAYYGSYFLSLIRIAALRYLY